MRNGRLNKKPKEDFLTILATVIKKDAKMTIRKHSNELKVHQKTVRTAIKQDLSPDLNFLDCAIFLKHKTKQMELPIQILVLLRV